MVSLTLTLFCTFSGSTNMSFLPASGMHGVSDTHAADAWRTIAPVSRVIRPTLHTRQDVKARNKAGGGGALSAVVDIGAHPRR